MLGTGAVIHCVLCVKVDLVVGVGGGRVVYGSGPMRRVGVNRSPNHRRDLFWFGPVSRWSEG